MSAAGITTQYVMDGNNPLTADAGGNVTTFLYGLGPVAEKTTTWNYALPDGSNTPRQLTDASGEVTFAARYTPWGDTLETYGTGNFEFGYFGGMMDEASGLLYIGNGQYYDPSTGRFLNRDAKPNSNNPYIPWDPMGTLFAPLGLLAIFLSRRKKGSKWGVWLALLLVVMSVGMGLSACGNGQQETPTPFTAVITTTPGKIIIQYNVGGTVVGTYEAPTSTPLPTITATLCTDTPTPTPTPLPIPTQVVEHINLSSYYTVYENQNSYGGEKVAIRATLKNNVRSTNGEYLLKSTYLGFTNNASEAQKAYSSFLYDPAGLCWQGSGKLENGLYISCVDEVTNITGFNWYPPEHMNRLSNPLETVAICGISYLTPFRQGDILEIPAITALAQNNGKTGFFKVVDVGGNLCEAKDQYGNIVKRDTLDIYAGEGSSAYELTKVIRPIDDTVVKIYRGVVGSP
jgi:RHS repeat-associated protein